MISAPTIAATPPLSSRFRKKRSIDGLLGRIDQLARRSLHLRRTSATYSAEGQDMILPSYVHRGPQSGDSPIRIGIFAAIHGDEPEGAHAIVELIESLERAPEKAAGYVLFLYPVCNPYGYEWDTRGSLSGHDLNREFWSGSREPEVTLLEEELSTRGLDGILSLHSDDTSDGLYGFVRGRTLSQHLLEPALTAASRFLPRNTHSLIDGFAAVNGIIQEGYPGILSPPPSVGRQPFEIVFETPANATAIKQRQSFLAAIHSVLDEYRKFISYGANI